MWFDSGVDSGAEPLTLKGLERAPPWGSEGEYVWQRVEEEEAVLVEGCAPAVVAGCRLGLSEPGRACSSRGLGLSPSCMSLWPGCCLRIGISNKFPVAVAAFGLGTTFWRTAGGERCIEKTSNTITIM